MSAALGTGRDSGGVAVRARVVGVVGWLVFVAMVSWQYVVLPLRHLGSTGGDFRGYHQAARALLEGRSPYLEGAFSYPPLQAIVVLPLAGLSLEAARGIWFAGSLLALLGAFLLTYRLLGRTRSALAATATVWSLAGTVPENLVLGQVNPFLLLLLAAAGVVVARRPSSAAAVIGVAAALKVWPGALLLIFVLRRQWRALAVGVATAALLFAVPALVAREMIDGPLAVTEQSLPIGTTAPLNVSLPALALRLADPPRDGVMPAPWLEGSALRGWEPMARRGWLSAAVALGVLAAAALALRRARSGGPGQRGVSPLELGLLTAAAILASPVSWYHYQLCQYPALAMALDRRMAAGRWRAAALVAAFSVALTRAQPWAFGRYVETWGWTAAAPAALWLSTGVGPILATAWLLFLMREAAPSSAPESSTCYQHATGVASRTQRPSH